MKHKTQSSPTDPVYASRDATASYLATGSVARCCSQYSSMQSVVQHTGHGTADSTAYVNQSHESPVVSRSTEDALPGGDANPHAWTILCR